MSSSIRSSARCGTRPARRPRLRVEALEDRRLLSVTADGSEFRVNTYTTSVQEFAAVATDAAGDFVVVWESYGQDGDNDGVYAQRYNAAGVTQGSEFRVNTYTTSSQYSPAVSMDSDGDFVVAWTSSLQDGSNDGVYAQRYNAAGVAQGSEFRVNTYTTGQQLNPAIAVDADGDFVVAWQSDQEGSIFGVYAQRYNAAGVAQGGEFQVNTYTTSSQRSSAVAMDADGDFVVAWQSFGQDGPDFGIYAQRYNAAGVAQGSEFRVNTYTTNAQVNAAVAMDADGEFIVAWDSSGQDGNGYGIYAQRYNAAGVAQGSEFRVNTYTTNAQVLAAVAMDADGDFVVVWQSLAQDGNLDGIFAQPYNAAGVAQGGEFQVNTYTTGSQRFPALAMDADGDFVVAWNSFGQDGSSTGVYAQRYVDTALPTVTEVRTQTGEVISQAEAINHAISSLTVQFVRNMSTVGGTGGANSVTNPANYQLLQGITDISSSITGVTYAYNLATSRFEATLTLSPSLVNGSYQLTVQDSVQSEHSQALDGDNNSVAGGDFVRSFSVALASVSLSPATVSHPEGNAGTTQYVFTATLSAASGDTATVAFATANGTATTAGGDYTATSGTLTFTPGQTVKLITALANGDTTFETDEAFNVALSSPTNATLGTASAAGEIQNDDPVPTVSLSPASVAHPEGNSGTTSFVYTVALANASVQTVTVAVATADDTATTADGDYAGTSGTLTFTPGQTVQLITVLANGDTTDEADETFSLALSSPANATLGAASAAGVIQNDDDVALPAGSEFQVNTYTTSHQGKTAVAVDAAGNFVVVWQSYGQDGGGGGVNDFGVYAQRYNAAGVAQGSEFQVNTYTTDGQGVPSVAMDADGDFVVTWTSIGQDGDGYGTYAQRYSAAGVAQGSEFRVNTYTIDNQGFASVAMDADGDFVVAWLSYGQDGDDYGIYAQRYNAAGVAQGSEFQVNTYTTNGQVEPSVAMDADGDFVVAWESFGQDEIFPFATDGVYAQRYNAAGVAQGSEFQVNSFTTGNQDDASVAMDAVGNFVVAWDGFGPDGDGNGVYARRYDAAGVVQGSELHVNTYTTDFQREPSVAMDADGNFVVVWQSLGQDGSTEGVYAQRYNAVGVAQGSEFQVNTFTTADQEDPSVAMDANGDFVVAWESFGQDGDGYGVYAQRYINPALATVTEVRTQTGEIVSQAETIDHAISSLTIQFSRNMSTVGGSGGAASVTNPANYQLLQGAVDISSSITGVTYGYNPATAHFEAVLTLSSSLVGGTYQLTVQDTAQSETAQALDGDGNSVAGGDFVRNFGVLVVLPAGSEFLVNTYTTSDQVYSAVASDAAGNFVVTWTSVGSQDGSGYGVYAQRYNAAGVAQGSEFLVNSNIVGNQGVASVAMDADGDFVVAWTSLALGQDGSGAGVYAQRYNAAGVPQGSEFLVNTYTTDLQGFPSVAMDADGDFVVAWHSLYQDLDGYGVYAQRYNSAGVAQGSEFQVNTYTTAHQGIPTVAMDANGDFVVAWISADQDGSGYGIYAQRYGATGVAQGSEFRVNTFTSADQDDASVAIDSDGDFVVSWESLGQDGSANGVYAQRYNAAGVAQGTEFRVNTFTAGGQDGPAVAMQPDGSFVIAWESFGQDGDDDGIYAQRYNAAGVPQGSELQVNSYTTSAQEDPSVAMDADGDFVVAWLSLGQDGDGYGLYAQRYINTTPATVTDVTFGSVHVQFSRNVSTEGGSSGPNSATNPANYQLFQGMTDISGSITGITYAYNTATAHFEATITVSPPLAGGSHELIVSDNIHSEHGQPLDGDGDGVPSGDAEEPFEVPSATIAGRQLFYNRSAFDGNNASINASDDAAIAIDKTAYLPGAGLAVFDNVSSYSRGINGIMIDLQGAGDHAGILLSTLASDFVFKVGNNNTPSSWAAAPTPNAVSVRTNFDGSGTDRVVITWTDGAIKNQWLEVQVLPTSRTGLTSTDVFFWGNKIGDIGSPTATSFATTAAGDAGPIISGGLGPAGGITNPRDIDRSNTITAAGDRAAATANIGAIARINIGSGGPFAPGAGDGDFTNDAGSGSAVAAALASKWADSALQPQAPRREIRRSDGASARLISARPADGTVNVVDRPRAGFHSSDLLIDLALDEDLLDSLLDGFSGDRIPRSRAP